MIYIDLNIVNIFKLEDVNRDVENLHNVFKYSIPTCYHYENILLMDDKQSVRVVFGDFNYNQEQHDMLQSMVQELAESYSKASFETLKNDYIDAIDSKTRTLIYSGAVFDNHMFSLSDTAQRNWIAIRASADTYEAMNAYPVPITTSDDEEYLLLNKDHLIAFTTSMLMAVAKYYNSGRDLKLLVKAATTKDQILAIRDKRR